MSEEKEPAMKNIANFLFEAGMLKSKVGCGIEQERIAVCDYGAELCTKIKVMGFLPKETISGHEIAQRTFAGARWTKKQDRINRERMVCLHG